MDTAQQIREAQLAIREGRLARARSLLRQVLRRQPRNDIAWLLLAQATTDKQLAREYIRRARTLQAMSEGHGQARLQPNTAAKKSAAASHPGWRPALPFASLALFMLLILALSGVVTLRDTLAPQLWPREQTVHAANVATDQTVTATPEQPGRADGRSAQAGVETAERSPPAATKEPSPSYAFVSEELLVPFPYAGRARAAQADTPHTPPLPDAIMRGMTAEGAGTAAANEETGRVIAHSTAEVEKEVADLAAAGNRSGTAGAVQPPGLSPGERWIDVNLTTQTLTAYEGDTPVLHSLISSGIWQFPTVTGQFRTWMKHETQNMSGYHLGYNYYLEGVPHVMYFYRDYAIHGAYWHNDFGTPMSHGCVNMSIQDAAWLFDWAPLGTLVNVHY